MNILDILGDHANILKNATIIQFDYNGIVHVKQLPMSKVKYLSLRHNKINVIDDMAFTNLKFLAELDLSYNSLTAEKLKHNVFKVGICASFIVYHVGQWQCEGGIFESRDSQKNGWAPEGRGCLGVQKYNRNYYVVTKQKSSK